MDDILLFREVKLRRSGPEVVEEGEEGSFVCGLRINLRYVSKDSLWLRAYEFISDYMGSEEQLTNKDKIGKKLGVCQSSPSPLAPFPPP